jgi:hypothetical protein
LAQALAAAEDRIAGKGSSAIREYLTVMTAHVILCVVLAAIVLRLSLSVERRDSVQTDELQAVAARWNGHLDRPGLFAYGEVMFCLGDRPARLHLTPRDKRRRNTHLSILFPDRQLNLKLYSAGDLPQMLGVRDMSPRISSFEETFVVTCPHPARLTKYLNDHVQVTILALANLPGVFAPDLQLSIQNGVLRVTKHTSADETGDLVQLVRCFESMYQAFLSARDADIDWAAKPLPLIPSQSQCQVCGEALSGKIVSCASCQTPHHLDCWQYFGSCSVYGCGQKRYTQPRRTKG